MGLSQLFLKSCTSLSEYPFLFKENIASGVVGGVLVSNIACRSRPLPARVTMKRRLRPYHLHSFYAHNAGADIDSIGDIEALSTWSAWRAGATLLDSSGREKIPHYAARYIDSGPVIGQEAPQLHGRVTELRTRMYQTSG
ncbi:predicted protein [Histoplasma capsulatum var. duboisii H88]|uniref:Predicted protein n=1 Tax=Ajellomyces capsulatus (strain H88) TaxID=544711 RepID=F0UU79_AJEC8|nr:predicted protein [Histoplasma capsulatum var. duboisii H88]